MGILLPVVSHQMRHGCDSRDGAATAPLRVADRPRKRVDARQWTGPPPGIEAEYPPESGHDQQYRSGLVL